MNHLPRSIKRQSARSTHEREEVVLDHFEIVRDVQTAILGTPDADTYAMAAMEMDLRVEQQGEAWFVYQGQEMVAAIVEGPDGAIIAPVE